MKTSITVIKPIEILSFDSIKRMTKINFTPKKTCVANAGRGNTFSKELKTEIGKQFKSGIKPIVLAKKHNMAESTIYSILNLLGIRKIKRKTIDSITRQQVVNSRLKGLSIKATAELHKVSTHFVHKHMAIYNKRNQVI